MAYDEELAERVRLVLADAPGLYERAMFGGLAFMVSGGHMACGIAGDRLMVRLGAEGGAQAMQREHVGPMDLTGTPMKSVVLVDAEAVRDDADLEEWVRAGTDFVATLPAKKAKKAT